MDRFVVYTMTIVEKLERNMVVLDADDPIAYCVYRGRQWAAVGGSGRQVSMWLLRRDICVLRPVTCYHAELAARPHLCFFMKRCLSSRLLFSSVSIGKRLG